MDTIRDDLLFSGTNGNVYQDSTTRNSVYMVNDIAPTASASADVIFLYFTSYDPNTGRENGRGGAMTLARHLNDERASPDIAKRVIEENPKTDDSD